MTLLSPSTVDSVPFSTLPESFHYQGEPTAWTKITRPGMRLHSFLEGLVISPEGELLLTDVPHGRIFSVSPDGSHWQEKFVYDGEPHGLTFLPDGRVVVADYRRGLLVVDLVSGSMAPLCSGYNTENFRGLSDLVADQDGAIWFTDSGRTSLSDPTGRLFRVSPAGELRCVLDNVPYPNGVAISADGANVFVAVTRGNAVWRLARALPASGKPMAGIYLQLSGGLGPDGLSVSSMGMLAVAHAQAGSAWLLDEVGQVQSRIRTPGGMWTTSVRFSRDAQTLYIVDAQTATIFKHSLTQ
ncbi:SMP-30/gluconolactonase/LRE family protein [Paraburkholderia fungorum]|uniref:SMP-30/gluconolactonase/LRE family protein n=1 Tax=Paraburkholderia fungorum TaxID=134537 RepID=UPI00402B2806